MDATQSQPCADLEKFWLRMARNTCQGVTLVDSLTEIGIELAGTRVGEAAADVKLRIMADESLHTAMARHPDVFGAQVVALVEGGGRAGIYDKVFMLILEQAWRCPVCILSYPAQKPKG